MRSNINLKAIFFNTGFKEVNTRHWTQDAIENFFGQIRAHGFRATDPTCMQFGSIFKILMINNITSGKVYGGNCQDDDGRFSFSWANRKDTTPVIPDDLGRIPRTATKTTPFKEKGHVQCNIGNFSKAALKHIQPLRKCPQCKQMLDIVGSCKQSNLGKIFCEVKEILKKLLPTIFTHDKIIARLTAIIQKEITAERFSCQFHRDTLARDVIRLISRQYFDATVCYLNKILSGTILIQDLKSCNLYSRDAHVLYSKSIPKKNRLSESTTISFNN